MVKPYYNSQHKLLYLSTNYFNQIKSHFFAMPINEDDLELLRIISKYKSNKNDQYFEALDAFIFKYSFLDELNIVSFGNANKKGNYSKFNFLLDFFVKKSIAEDRKRKLETVYYRNYEKSHENWENTAPFVNVCADFIISWQSVLRKLGAKKVNGLNNKYIPFNILVFSLPTSKYELNKIKKEWKM